MLSLCMRKEWLPVSKCRYDDYCCLVSCTLQAVANAQHAVAMLGTLLKDKGADVEFGVHPVAGRMPGQVSNAAHLNIQHRSPLADVYLTYDSKTEVCLCVGVRSSTCCWLRRVCPMTTCTR